MRSIRETWAARGQQATHAPPAPRAVDATKPTLSLAAVCGSRPESVRAFLEAWRPLVDEIVLAVEEDRDTSTFDVCADLVDRTFLLPASAGPMWMERYLGWLHEQCTCDWILRADDDELPSEALSVELNGLLAERELTHVWVPRQWVFPDAEHHIAEGLWLRDIQVRLVRNEPGIWQLSGGQHSNLVVEGAGRIAAGGLLHLDPLIKPRTDRMAKIDAYRRELGEIVSDGYAIFEVYDPESVADIQLAALPEADTRTILSYLGRADEPRPADQRRHREPTPVDAGAIDSWVGVRSVGEGAYSAEIRLLHPLRPIPAGAIRHIQLEVTNTGTDWWPRGPIPQPLIRVGHRWRDADGTERAIQTPRTPFTERVAPGASTRLVVAIQAPPHAGPAVLEIDLVHELVRWFEHPLRLMAEITEPACAAVGQRFTLRDVELEFGTWTTPGLRAAFESGWYEGLEADIVTDVVTAEDAVLELGCGVGFITTLAARTGARVFSYDANPQLVEIARATLARNGVRAQVATGVLQLDPATATVPFYVHTDFWTSSLQPAPDATAIDVPTIDFQTTVTAQNISCLIVDIEGAEVELLTASLPGSVRKLCVECHPTVTSAESTHRMLTALLTQGFVLDLQRSHPPVLYLERIAPTSESEQP